MVIRNWFCFKKTGIYGGKKILMWGIFVSLKSKSAVFPGKIYAGSVLCLVIWLKSRSVSLPVEKNVHPCLPYTLPG